MEHWIDGVQKPIFHHSIQPGNKIQE